MSPTLTKEIEKLRKKLAGTHLTSREIVSAGLYPFSESENCGYYQRAHFKLLVATGL